MPFAVAGFARTSAWMSASAFVKSASSLNETLPMRAWTMPAFSTRYSTLPALASRDRRLHVEGDRPHLGVGHEAARAQDAPELTHLPHHVGRGDHAVEVHEALLDLGHELLRAHEVGAGRLRLLRLLALREDQHPERLPGAVRKHHGAADHLVRVARVDAQPDREVHRLVELGRGRLLHEGTRFDERVLLRAVDVLPCRFLFLGDFRHVPSFAVAAYASHGSPVVPW